MSDPEAKSNVSQYEAFRKHIHHNINILMDTSNTQDKLELEMGNVQLAYGRFVEDPEKWEIPYHQGVVAVRYREVIGLFSDRILAHLLDGKVAKKDIPDIEVALRALERNEITYPVGLSFLKDKLLQLKSQSLNPSV